MNGKISKHGYLMLERNGEWNIAKCPHGGYCEALCVLFGEPEPEKAYVMSVGGYEETGKTDLSLCTKILTFDNFTDERNRKEASNG